MANRCEQLIRKIAKRLHEQQKAKLWKIPNDLRITSSGVLAFGDQSPVDFMGHTITGRALFVECKDLVSTSCPIGKSGIKPHQWLALEECHRAGGLAILVWAHMDFISALDMDLIRSLTRGRKSISWKAIPDEWVRPFGEAGIMELFDKHRIGGS